MSEMMSTHGHGNEGHLASDERVGSRNARNTADVDKEAPVKKQEDGVRPAPQRPWYHPIEIFWLLVANWFLIGIGVSIVLAWRFPNVAAHGGVLASQWSIEWGGIAGIFLITGLTLTTKALVREFWNYRLHLFTQIFSFLFFSSFMFVIVNIIKAAHNDAIDSYIMVGLMVMAVLPTTVASNITMTRLAGGNEEAATMQVCIGNGIGIFIAPLLAEMYFSAPGWSFGQPVASGGLSSSAGLKEIYRQVGKQMGLTLFLPLVVGQLLQNFFPKQTKWVSTTFRLQKVSTFLLLLLIWSVFSTQFDEGAFQFVPPSSIILVVFLNLFIYLGFTVLCVLLTRLPFLPADFDRYPNAMDELPNQHHSSRLPSWRNFVLGLQFTKRDSTAICFCAAAKGMVVGTPMLDILYGGLQPRDKAIVTIPLVLYQGQQVAIAQILTSLFRRWNAKPDRLAKQPRAAAEATPTVSSPNSTPDPIVGPDTEREAG